MGCNKERKHLSILEQLRVPEQRFRRMSYGGHSFAGIHPLKVLSSFLEVWGRMKERKVWIGRENWLSGHLHLICFESQSWKWILARFWFKVWEISCSVLQSPSLSSSPLAIAFRDPLCQSHHYPYCVNILSDDLDPPRNLPLCSDSLNITLLSLFQPTGIELASFRPLSSQPLIAYHSISRISADRHLPALSSVGCGFQVLSSSVRLYLIDPRAYFSEHTSWLECIYVPSFPSWDLCSSSVLPWVLIHPFFRG